MKQPPLQGRDPRNPFLNIDARLWYFSGYNHLIGRQVSQGDVLGSHMSMQNAYSGITEHVHLQLDTGSLTDHFDPTPYL